MGGAILGNMLGRGFVRQVETPAARMFADGLSRASSAQDAKSGGRDLEKVMTGQMSPQQFGQNLGMTLLGNALGRAAGYPFGGATGSMVETATSFGFGFWQQK
jgi:hypothetical protein